MKYFTPELQLVGAAQGLVLGSVSGTQFDCILPNAADNPGGKMSRKTPDFQSWQPHLHIVARSIAGAPPILAGESSKEKIVKYSSPEIRLVGAARDLVLAGPSYPAPDCIDINLLDNVRPFSRQTPDF